MSWIYVAGHLGSDAEERFTPGGQKVISFRIAVRTRKKGQDDTIWYRVSVWGDRFDKMVPYLKKGSPLMVSGELQKPEVYTDRNGQPQISLDITAESLKFSPFGRGSQEGQQQQPQQQQATPAPQPVAAAAQSDDDLPF